MWTRQPLVYCDADWSNPLTEGLCALFNHGILWFNSLNPVTGTPVNAVNGLRPAIFGQSVSKLLEVRPGVGLNFAAATTDRYDSNTLPGMSGSTAFTLFSLQTVNLTAAQKSTLDADNETSARIFQLKLDASNKATFVRFNTGGSVFVAADAAAVTANQAAAGVCIGAVSNGAAISIWTDRKKTVGSAVSGTPAGMTSTISVGVHRPTTLSVPFDGTMLLWGAWTRALGDEEMISLVDNPWQLFARPSLRVFAPLSASTSSRQRWFLTQ